MDKQEFLTYLRQARDDQEAIETLLALPVASISREWWEAAFTAEYPIRATAVQYYGSSQDAILEEIVGYLTTMYKREAIPVVRQAIVWCLRAREDLLPSFLDDPHEGVRIETVLCLGRIGSVEAAKVLFDVACQSDGRTGRRETV
ncbi:MAG: HEAT repeat domain-containing protein, partial [Candidatus Latescibacteria bacterium]|nr:HEAT repeat domain-containing protein [Candidatus Latescibacterota bacterium]